MAFNSQPKINQELDQSQSSKSRGDSHQDSSSHGLAEVSGAGKGAPGWGHWAGQVVKELRRD